MSIPSLFDSTISRLGYALDGLSARQDIITNNIANADTPGYLTHDINFEQQLQSVINDPMGTQNAAIPANLPDSFTRNDLRVRNDGNNVDLNQQMTEMSRTTVVYQAATELINGKFGLLTSALAPIS